MSDINAPTLAASSVELFVAIAVENYWELRQLLIDVKQAFIQADFDYIFLIKLPDDVL